LVLFFDAHLILVDGLVLLLVSIATGCWLLGVITQHHVFGALKNEWLAILGGKNLVKFHPTDKDIISVHSLSKWFWRCLVFLHQ
jgi:hypothetical protein